MPHLGSTQLNWCGTNQTEYIVGVNKASRIGTCLVDMVRTDRGVLLSVEGRPFSLSNWKTDQYVVGEEQSTFFRATLL